MKAIIVLFAITCLLASGSNNPYFPWLNLGAAGGFALICISATIRYYKQDTH